MDISATVKNMPVVKKLRVRNKKVLSPENNKNDRFVVEDLIVKEVGGKVDAFLKKHINLNSDKCFVTKTTTRFNIDKLSYDKYHSIVNLSRINDLRYINKFFESVNNKLLIDGIYISSVEIYINRKKKILAKHPKPFNRLHYFFDVIYTRLFPKLPVAKKIYFFLTKGKNRVLSKAETFGRLYSCGFEIADQQLIGNLLYFVARKKKEPEFNFNPTYGPIIRLKRHGKDGKLFNVYKLRTMHPYSEYLQEYVYQYNSLKEGGKFHNDFRISTEGKFFRKFWLDELPMLVNLLKREMKLVGVRPLSSHYFSLYTEELKKMRVKHKPGLVPPFYVDNPKTLEEIMESEMRYLKAYEKHPFRTDFVYFWKAFYNIVFKKARSA